MGTYLAGLECTMCGRSYPPGGPATVCPACGRVLFHRYDLERARRHLSPDLWSRRPPGVWRYRDLLPLQDPFHLVTLGEGGTPLLPAPTLAHRLGCRSLYIKDEGQNPTGTFKARGMAVAVSCLRELGVRRVVVPSAGNAGGALSAYGARAGMEVVVVLPQDAPRSTVEECRAYGARLDLVPGGLGEAGWRAREWASREGAYDLSTLREPYRVEGKKTMGLEVLEALGWRSPDYILYPTGGGTGLLGIWKAVGELEALGWLRDGKKPRLVCVQSEGCAPLVKAFREGRERVEPWEAPRTLAAGLRVPSPFADDVILRALRESGGTALAVSDGEIVQAVREMAEAEGLFPCPEGAAALAGLRKGLREGLIDPEGVIVLLNTGTGLKYLDALG